MVLMLGVFKVGRCVHKTDNLTRIKMKPQKSILLSTLTLALFAVVNPLDAAPGYNDGGALPTSVNQTILAEDHGVIANDGFDDSASIQAIIDGIDIDNSPSNLISIVLPAGEINIGQEVHVDRSGIIIQGAGSNPATGTKIVVNSWQPYTVASDNAPDFDKKFWPGFAAFRTETRLKHPNEQAYEGSINFHWKHSIEFGQPASIGDTVLKLESGGGDKFESGDLVYVGAASDDSFLDLGRVPNAKRSNSHIESGHMRTQIFVVTAVNQSSDEVTIDRPLEFDVPLKNEHNYNSRVMPVTAVEGVGYRDFYLTMENAGTSCAVNNADTYNSSSNPNGVGYRYENVCAADAIHGILFKFANNGFVDNVSLEMTGSHPIVTEFAKNMTFSNNSINGSWNKGAGGNGYFRGSKLYNSWIVGNTIENVRHLTLQWSATGNLVENNLMNVDFNLHGGWERNNIIRDNTISVPFEHQNWTGGAPGDGTWQPIWYASGDHASNWAGPTGPNNAFLNNTLEKATAPGAAITTWGLFDTPNTIYRFGWDGSGFAHLNIDGDAVATWTQELAEGVHSQMPMSGVFTEVVSGNDSDNDGVADAADQCPNTPAGSPVDNEGCAVVDGDDDNDGVANSADQCPNTPAGADVDADGCELVDGDDDNDGVLNSIDQCPNTPPGTNVDSTGCPEVMNSACSSIIDVEFRARTELVLSGSDTCVRFDQDLSGKKTQFWDSDTNSSCDFRGSITAVDGSGSLSISSNYASFDGFTGTTFKISPSNGCSFIKARAY